MILEFYKWLGCHFFMACFQGIQDCKEWWLTATISMFFGAPFHLNEFMMGFCFKEILAVLTFTDVPPATMAQGEFINHFHNVRKLIDVWNNHMATKYYPSWLNCLDESMNSWLSKYCPHLFGNEYHTIANGDSGKPIIWRIKLAERKGWMVGCGRTRQSMTCQ